MGIFARGLGINALSLEDPAQPLMPMSALFDSLGLGRSDAGVVVNEKQAMRLTTAYSCIKIISEDLSRLPLDIFQDMPDGSMRLATEHRCYPLLHDRPNPKMSSMVWRGAMLASMLAYGNAYSWIKRDRAARVMELWPLASDKTHPATIDGNLGYVTTQTPDGKPQFIPAENVLHFMGLTLDGISGMSPIGTCKNAFGLGMAAEKFGAQFFGSGARSTGVLSHPGQLDTEAYENLKKSVREWATGESALRPIILEEGLKWEQISIPPNDAQFLETRKFQKEEIAQLYRVPLHLLQDLSRSTNNNIEHQGLDYVRFCLAPNAVRLEQEITYKLLSGPFLAEHNLNDLQRGDFLTQTQGFQALRNIGVYSANRILRALRQNPISAEEGGDVLTVQGGMIPLSALVNFGGTPNDQGPDTNEGDPNGAQGNPAAAIRKRQISAAFNRLFRDAAGRITNQDARNPRFVRSCLHPPVSSMAQSMLAMHFGTSELSKRDEAAIEKQVSLLAVDAKDWKRGEAAAIPNNVTYGLYAAFAEEFSI